MANTRTRNTSQPSATSTSFQPTLTDVSHLSNSSLSSASPTPSPSSTSSPSSSPSPTASPSPSSSSKRHSAKMMPLHNLPRTSSSSDNDDISHTAVHNGKHRPNITDLTISIPGSERRRTDEPPPPRWRTPEFMFYGLLFLIFVPLLVWWPIKLSSTASPNYPTYSHRLSPGWLYWRQVDASDPQYRTFRSNFFSLLILAAVYLILSHVGREGAGVTSPEARSSLIAVFSVILIVVFHGLSALKIGIILTLNYLLAKERKPSWLNKPWSVLVVVLNMGILFANWKFDGYKFGDLHPAFAHLDTFGGLIPRWHIGFNITMLRIVSFALDYHWRAFEQEPSSPPSDYRGRVNTPLPDEDYNVTNFIAYILYPPLYIAGPIMTFQDFVWQLKNPVTITWKERRSYLIRFGICMLTMESILHTMYVTAIKDTKAWDGDSPADLALIGFWNLVIVWLKLLIPWRFFRAFALLDGIDPPENMVRCVANNYSTLGFWRSWHRSYNLWLLRYIYIPLGGSKNMIIATTFVFTFVALWHDLSFKLLAWGWLISLFILPEIIGRKLVPASKYGEEWWYRHVAAAGGVFNILLMMGANLVGFVLGLDGMKYLLHQLTTTSHGWTFSLLSCSILFVAVQVMFEYREEEARQGIDRRC